MNEELFNRWQAGDEEAWAKADGEMRRRPVFRRMPPYCSDDVRSQAVIDMHAQVRAGRIQWWGEPQFWSCFNQLVDWRRKDICYEGQIRIEPFPEVAAPDDDPDTSGRGEENLADRPQALNTSLDEPIQCNRLGYTADMRTTPTEAAVIHEDIVVYRKDPEENSLIRSAEVALRLAGNPNSVSQARFKGVDKLRNEFTDDEGMQQMIDGIWGKRKQIVCSTQGDTVA